jgi:hypothetical protein
MLIRRSALLLLTCLVLVPQGIEARGVRRAVMLRMEGYFGPPPEGRREEADLVLRIGDADRPFQVTRARIVSGDGLASQVFDRVAPYKPSFIVRGPEELLKRLREAPQGARLAVTAQWIAASRNLLVGSVDPVPPAP